MVRRVSLRIEDVTGLTMDTAEELQVLKWTNGRCDLPFFPVNHYAYKLTWLFITLTISFAIGPKTCSDRTGA